MKLMVIPPYPTMFYSLVIEKTTPMILDLEHVVQAVRVGLVWAEDPEVLLPGVVGTPVGYRG
jgi:hypothetical protein